MLQRMRDNSTQFIITTIIAVIAIAIPLIYTYRTQSTKELQVFIDSSTYLVDVKPDVAANIEVRYKDRPVSNASIIQVRLVNTGNQPIQESDYVRTVSFNFAPQQEVIDYSIVSEQPSNIGLKLNQVAKNKIEVLPALLNGGDSTTIKFIVIGQSNNPFSMDGRIIGIEEVKVLQTSEQSNNPKSTLQTVGQFILLVLVAIFASIGFVEIVGILISLALFIKRKISNALQS